MSQAELLLLSFRCVAPFIFLFAAQQLASQPVLSEAKDRTLVHSVRYSASLQKYLNRLQRQNDERIK